MERFLDDETAQEAMKVLSAECALCTVVQWLSGRN